MASKRLTAEQRREHEEQEIERRERRFLARLAEAQTRRDLIRLADDPRTSQGKLGDEYHHWLGCALHRNPYDEAPRHVREAILDAIVRTKETEE